MLGHLHLIGLCVYYVLWAHCFVELRSWLVNTWFFGYYTALLAVLYRLGRYLFLQFIVPGSLCGQPVFAAHAYAMLNEAGKWTMGIEAYVMCVCTLECSAQPIYIFTLIHMVPLVPFDLKHKSCKFGTDLNTFRCPANWRLLPYTYLPIAFIWDHIAMTYLFFVTPKPCFIGFPRSLKPNQSPLNIFRG